MCRQRPVLSFLSFLVNHSNRTLHQHRLVGGRRQPEFESFSVVAKTLLNAGVALPSCTSVEPANRSQPSYWAKGAVEAEGLGCSLHPLRSPRALAFHIWCRLIMYPKRGNLGDAVMITRIGSKSRIPQFGRQLLRVSPRSPGCLGLWCPTGLIASRVLHAAHCLWSRDQALLMRRR